MAPGRSGRLTSIRSPRSYGRLVSQVDRARPASVANTQSGGSSVAGVSIVIAAPLDYPEREQLRVSPDWERVYIFAADSEATVRAPGVLELF